MKVAVVLLSVLCLWLAVSLVRVENERYALFVGMCQTVQITPGADPNIVKDWNCLSKVQTRTSPLWHLFYALTGT